MSKKTRTLVLLALFLMPILLIKPNSSGAAGSLDQSCMIMEDDAASFGVQINRDDSNYLSQTFVPSMNRLTGVKIFVNGDGKGQAYIDVYKYKTLIARSSFQNEPNGWGVITYNLTDTAMTPGATYRLIPRLASGNNSLLWYIKIGACYPPGVAYFGNDTLEIPQDFGFATYGYNASGSEGGTAPGTPGTPGANSEEQSQSAGTANLSAGLRGEEPKAPSSDIAAPKNLSVQAKKDMNTLRWESSTTMEVDGYKIFRSDKEDGKFLSVGETGAGALSFSDANIEPGKTYYYFVRATMGEKESASSNIVKAEYKETSSAGDTEDNSLIVLFNSMPLWEKVLVILGVLILLILSGYLVYEAIKHYKATKQKKLQTLK